MVKVHAFDCIFLFPFKGSPSTFLFSKTLRNNSWKICEETRFCRMFQFLNFLFTCRVT